MVGNDFQSFKCENFSKIFSNFQFWSEGNSTHWMAIYPSLSKAHGGKFKIGYFWIEFWQHTTLIGTSVFSTEIRNISWSMNLLVVLGKFQSEYSETSFNYNLLNDVNEKISNLQHSVDVQKFLGPETCPGVRVIQKTWIFTWTGF